MKVSLVVAVALLCLFCVVPVAIVAVDTFVGPHGPTLVHYYNAFTTLHAWGTLWDSIRIAVGSTVFALLLGVPYAFFVTRVRTPLRSIFGGLYIFPLVLPPLLSAMGWTQFLTDVQKNPGFPGPDSILGGILGCSFLFGLAYFPFVVLFAKKAFLEIGAGLEEAARISTGAIRAFFRVTLRLSVPAILAGSLFVFLFSINDFSVVDYLSTVAPVANRPQAYPFQAFAKWSTRNYQKLDQRREAEALGLPLAAISVGLLLAIYWLVEKGRNVTVVTGHVRPGFVEDRSGLPTRLTLRIVGLLFLTVVILLSVGIPLGRLFYEAGGGQGTLFTHIHHTLFDPYNAKVELGHSMLYSALAAVGMTLMAVVIGHHAVRKGPRWEGLALILSFLPLAFGSILFGVGLIRTWNHSFLMIGGQNPVYDTAVIVVIMMIGKYLPFALAAVMSSLHRIDPAYEEAAAVAGVRPSRRLLDIVLPLASKGVVAGLVLGFVFSVRELDTVVLLTGGGETVMMKIYTWVHIAHDYNVAALSLVLVVVITLPFLIGSIFTSRKIGVL